MSLPPSHDAMEIRRLSFICKVCERSFDSSEELDRHGLGTHRPVDDGREPSGMDLPYMG
jgi:hypothetical protein